jgi:hypothetical protein
MSATYIINKFNLLNTLKFPKQQYNTEHKVYVCGDREWIVAGDKNVFHSYKNHTENSPTSKFGLLYVDTENLNEYYREYPSSFVSFSKSKALLETLEFPVQNISHKGWHRFITPSHAWNYSNSFGLSRYQHFYHNDGVELEW